MNLTRYRNNKTWAYDELKDVKMLVAPGNNLSPIFIHKWTPKYIIMTEWASNLSSATIEANIKEGRKAWKNISKTNMRLPDQQDFRDLIIEVFEKLEHITIRDWKCSN